MLDALITRLQAGETVSVTTAMLKAIKYEPHGMTLEVVARSGTQYLVKAEA